MKSSRLLAFVFTILLTLPAVSSADDAQSFTALESNRQVTLGELRGQHTLVAFWRSDCAPCIAERPILTLIAKDHPDMRIVLVSLDANAYDQRHLAKPKMANMEIWVADGDAGRTLRTAGDRRGALPFSLFMRADGSVCARHYGLLGTELADGWAKQC